MTTTMGWASEFPSSVRSVATKSFGVREIAESRLRNSSYCAVRTIACVYHDGVLVLHGRVSAYYLKQVAQAVVAELDGVQEIANHIEVVRPDKSTGHYLPLDGDSDF